MPTPKVLAEAKATAEGLNVDAIPALELQGTSDERIPSPGVKSETEEATKERRSGEKDNEVKNAPVEAKADMATAKKDSPAQIRLDTVECKTKPIPAWRRRKMEKAAAKSAAGGGRRSSNRSI